MFLTLTPEVFDLVREKFGSAKNVGRELPRELPKAWTYLNEAWNTIARTPITSVIESVTDGDAKSFRVDLLSDGTKKKKKKKKKKKNNKNVIQLRLPDCFDAQVYKVAALVNHFNLHKSSPKKLFNSVSHTPSERESEYINAVLAKILSDPATHDLSEAAIYDNYVVSNQLLALYRGQGWKEWFITELKRIRRDPAAAAIRRITSLSPDFREKFAALKREFEEQEFFDAKVMDFVRELSRLSGPASCPFAVYKQWLKVMKECSSHWCPPPLWWCLGATLVGDNLGGMTRSLEGGLNVASTYLENWDMYALIKLLRSSIFDNDVHEAVENLFKYPRNDLAHERFDCDWRRDWECMAELLDALGCDAEKKELRDFCESKDHPMDAGELHE